MTIQSAQPLNDDDPATVLDAPGSRSRDVQRANSIPDRPARHKLPSPSRIDRIEAAISRMSGKSRFWQRISTLIWLPMAFRSGIRMKRVDSKSFTAVLPFRRFNRNWYNAMAGAALLANSEIAGGMYVFGECGGDYECVCKRLEYRFLRPCFGPAIYRVTTKMDLEKLAATGEEFNIDLVLNIIQQVRKPGGRVRRVGKCLATFHATPKMHQKAKRINKKKS